MHSRKKNISFDLLRILSAFMVVFLHVSSFDFYNYPVSSFNWKIYNIYDSMVRSSVPLFLMLSGTFLLDKHNKNEEKNF